MSWSKPIDMSDPEQAERARAYQESKLAQQRAVYTWGDAAKDLALSSPMTLAEAGDICREFERSGLYPFDVFPLLRVIYGSTTGRQAFARAIVDLVRLERTLDEGNWSS